MFARALILLSLGLCVAGGVGCTSGPHARLQINLRVADRPKEGLMRVVLIARFDGDVGKLKEAYDRGHAEIMRRGGAVRFGELRHHCATSRDALYIIGVWGSEEHARSAWAGEGFKSLLASLRFPATPTALPRP